MKREYRQKHPRFLIRTSQLAIFATTLLGLFLTGVFFVDRTPYQAYVSDTTLEDIDPINLVQRQTTRTRVEGLLLRVEVPKTTNEAVNARLKEYTDFHQEAFYQLTMKRPNRLKANQASFHLTFDWITLSDTLASVVFYEHWSINHVVHRSSVAAFVVDFELETMTPSKRLLNQQALDSSTLNQKVKLKLQSKRLFKSSNTTQENIVESFVERSTFIIERDVLTLVGVHPHLKTNHTHQTKVSIPFFSFPLLLHETLDERIPIRNNSPKWIAFTFDDGPNKHTAQVLDVLNKYDAKATFFVLGMQVEMYPALAKRIVEEGHEIANHSYSHKDLVKASKSLAIEQIKKTNDIITQTTGAVPTLLRPPYGRYNQHVKQYSDLRITLWNVDPLDWRVKDARVIASNILKDARDGSIVLMHDIYQTSAEALDIALKQLAEEGVEFVSVSKLLNRE